MYSGLVFTFCQICALNTPKVHANPCWCPLSVTAAAIKADFLLHSSALLYFKHAFIKATLFSAETLKPAAKEIWDQLFRMCVESSSHIDCAKELLSGTREREKNISPVHLVGDEMMVTRLEFISFLFWSESKRFIHIII